MSATRYGVFLEVGKKKVFAGAVDWPGWCRWGKDEEAALQALLDAGPRYAQVMAGAEVGFVAPEEVEAFEVIERVAGNATTDFGATDAALAGDEEGVGEQELGRMVRILGAIWAAFDEAVSGAEGMELRKGPRGGGRELAAIVNHVVEADAAYLRKLGWKMTREKGEEDAPFMARVREETLEGLRAAAAGQLPAEGPRGGKRWTVRRFVRRMAWHGLDHVWEVEERVVGN